LRGGGFEVQSYVLNKSDIGNICTHEKSKKVDRAEFLKNYPMVNFSVGSNVEYLCVLKGGVGETDIVVAEYNSMLLVMKFR